MTSEQTSGAERVEAYPFWYHTIDLPGGVTTPGEWDLRESAERIPWPNVRGLRCLDVGTFDGWWAFELERRGAASVVATDVADPDQLDWPYDVRPGIGDNGWEAKFAGTEFRHGGGFTIAADLLGSRAEWRALNIYDLDPDEVGRFDVVTCGSLLLHLRDPIRALEAVRSVCDGVFLSAEIIDPWLTVVHRRKPVAQLKGLGTTCQWWLANAAAHDRMLHAAGFEIIERSKPFVLALNGTPRGGLKVKVTNALIRAVTGQARPGQLVRAVVARPVGLSA
jgi:tRNA (mo5U34)-methyltransferase